jgi:hypothetical protein
VRVVELGNPPRKTARRTTAIATAMYARFMCLFIPVSSRCVFDDLTVGAPAVDDTGGHPALR